MSWIDIGIIAFVVLFGLFGALRGIKKSALSFGAFLLSFIIAFFLANVVAEALLGIDGVREFVLGTKLDGSGKEFSLANFVYQNLMNDQSVLSEKTFVGEHYYKPIAEIISDFGGYSMAFTPIHGLAVYTAFLMFSMICGVGIYIIARLLLVIVTVIVNSYIARKKSVASRVSGMALGMASGALWAFVFTLVFSCVGGMTFVPAFGSVEKEYEHNNAVVCQYFNEGAYAIRNKLFLPSADMYTRIVNLSGFANQTSEDPQDPGMSGERLDLYVNLKNLSYKTGTPWTVSDGRKNFNEDGCEKIDATAYANVEFDSAVTALLTYYENAATSVENKDKLANATQNDYAVLRALVYGTDGSNSLRNIMKKLNTALDNYAKSYAKALADLENEDVEKTDQWYGSINGTLSTYHGNVVEQLNAIKDAVERNGGKMSELAQFPSDFSSLIPAAKQVSKQA